MKRTDTDALLLAVVAGGTPPTIGVIWRQAADLYAAAHARLDALFASEEWSISAHPIPERAREVEALTALVMSLDAALLLLDVCVEAQRQAAEVSRG